MRDFIVKHPFISIHIIFMPLGWGAASLGLTMNELIFGAVVLGIPYSVITNRWEEAAARERTRQRFANYALYAGRGHADRPIHPR
jgi:hypothetical protein